jgi:hypothetical protein
MPERILAGLADLQRRQAQLPAPPEAGRAIRAPVARDQEPGART